jgi:hypothetical protein
MARILSSDLRLTIGLSLLALVVALMGATQLA